jgi:two-component sensor histidine kinase/HAMP domain-containing protein
MPRLIASVVGFITLASLILMSFLVDLGQRRLVSSLGERAEAAADHLALTLAFPVWNAVFREIDAQLEAAMLDPSLYGISLAMRDIDPPVRAWSRADDWSPRRAEATAAPGLIELRREVKQGNRVIASLELLYSKKFISQAGAREVLIFGALIFTEALTLAIGLYLIMRRSVFRPLRGIERWASEASLGVVAAMPPNLGRSGEIASLRDSIERMVRLLGERYEAIASEERRTRASLEQKAALVNELFHRTRNSLQVLSSIISLRESGAENEIAREELRVIQDRVFSISLAQEELFKNGDLSYVDLGSYLGALIERQVGERPGARDRIRARIDVERAPVIIDVALPIGLAVAEIVDNSLKHAFPGGRSGVISLSMKRKAEDSILLVLRDDGVGPPRDFDPARDARIGLETALALVQGQLQGSLTFDYEDGFACSILFADTGAGFAPRV